MKNLLTLTLVLLTALSLTACGGKTGTATSDGTNNSSTSEPKKTATEEPSKPVFTDGVWPDNEWTENIPQPPFTIGKVEYDGSGELIIHFTDVTYDAMVAYSDKIANVYNDATVIKTGTIYKWRTNVHDDDSISWTICLETEKDGTGFMTIINMQ